MFEVLCPTCNQVRLVEVWKKKDGNGPPYVKKCKSCSQKGKKLSDETKNKLSVPKPAEFGKLVSEQHKKQPHLKKNLIPGAGAGWNKGLALGSHSEETNRKIGEGVHNAALNEEAENDI